MTTPPTPPHRTISIIQYKTKSYMNSIPMRQKERQSLVIMCVDPRVIQQHFQSAPGVIYPSFPTLILFLWASASNENGPL